MNRPAAGLAVAAALMALASPAVAQVIEDPSWEQWPDPDVTTWLTPEFANWIGVSGRAAIACIVEADGHTFKCRAESETPEGLGFGAAARLVVASGQLRARRLGGLISPGIIRNTVRFYAPPIDQPDEPWDGPEPTARQLALAREVVESAGVILPIAQDSLGGLDFDRRAVVGPWVDELFPVSKERLIATRALQLARLLDEEDLKRLRNGEPVERPTDEAFRAAEPQATPEEIEALHELRRRYCARYGCGGDGLIPMSEEAAE